MLVIFEEHTTGWNNFYATH